MRAWGPSTGPTACALAGRRCALWGWRKGVPGGGAFRCREGRLSSGAPPLPAARPPGGLSGSATHVLWAWVCRCGVPALSPWFHCPVRAACRWGGGGPSSGVGSRGSATRMSRVRLVGTWGPSTGPTACALAGRRCSLSGWRRGVPGGGAFHRCEGRLRSGAPPPPTACPLGGLSGSAPHVLWARVCACGGPALSPRLACPVGAAFRGGGGGPSQGGVACHGCEGRLVSGAVPPAAAVLWGGQLGFCYPRVSWVRSVRVWGPSTGPKTCALAGRRCYLWGWRKGVPGGGAFPRCEGRLRSGTLPPPTARPLSGLSGSATHVLWARVCGCGGPVLSPWLACHVGSACRGGGGGRSPGGVACHGCEGRLVSGAVPPPAARPLGWGGVVPRPMCPGCGRCLRGDPAPAPQRAPVRAGIACCGARGRASPGGVPLAVVRGV